MNKEILFPMFNEWQLGKENKDWKSFIKDLNKLGIQNPWREIFNENDVRKLLGLEYVDEKGWTITKIGKYREMTKEELEKGEIKWDS